MTSLFRPSARRPATYFNRMSRWSYALLLLMLVTFTFHSLPTFFGEQPALGLHGQQALTESQIKQLADHQLTPQRVSRDGERLLLVFASQTEQQQAKALLDGQTSSAATLEFASNAPQWLSMLGAAPIKLGLDLRGGSQLLIGVDTDFVLSRQSRAMADEVRTLLREANLRGAAVATPSLDAVSVSLPAGTDDSALVSQLRRQSQGQWQLDRSDDALRLTLLPEARSRLIGDAVVQNLKILQKRLHELGIVEATVQRQGLNAIRIELPGVHNPKQAREVLGATASLAFYEVRTDSHFLLADRHGQPVPLARKAVLGGEHIIDARASVGETGQPQVAIVLDGQGGELMNRFSRSRIGTPMATVFTEYRSQAGGPARASNQVINIATIQSALGNQFRITGINSLPEAQDLAMLLRAGALTAPLSIMEERSIGPTLGAQNIQAGFMALACGMAGMALFMICWYRRFGWVAITALVANLLMQVGMLALLPGAVLTLPGIAGLVLTVGMAVDTHVLIFERIRDRVREGASLAGAIDFGYRSAFRTIFDANITTLISAVILYSIGSGPLQGFSITLMLGLMSSMVTGIWGTRAIINPLWGKSSLTLARI